MCVSAATLKMAVVKARAYRTSANSKYKEKGASRNGCALLSCCGGGEAEVVRTSVPFSCRPAEAPSVGGARQGATPLHHGGAGTLMSQSA